MLPQQQREELLSWAHVEAVASFAGVIISRPDRDFGIDGSFQQISIRGGRYFPSGYPLDFQLKASTRCQIEPEYVIYDLEVKTYNDLINREQDKDATPCILILKVLPVEPQDWLEFSEISLLMRGGCYWEYLQGVPSTNKERVRIRIPRHQQLTSVSLLQLLNRVKTKEWIY